MEVCSSVCLPKKCQQEVFQCSIHNIVFLHVKSVQLNFAGLNQGPFSPEKAAICEEKKDNKHAFVFSIEGWDGGGDHRRNTKKEVDESTTWKGDGEKEEEERENVGRRTSRIAGYPVWR